ncbi:NAD-binding protein [Kamptonema cortianum]|nr:NAD-binding protein [Kamptonema cortianum]
MIKGIHGSPMSFHENVEEIENHAIICGCGPVGRKLVDYFKATQKPFLVVELNPNTVKSLRQEGILALFADAAQTETHNLARTAHARTLVVTVPDVEIVSAIVSTAKKINRDIFIVCRAKFAGQMEALQKLGVDSIILDEREAGLEVLRRIMIREGDDPLDAVKEIRDLRLAEGDGVG